MALRSGRVGIHPSQVDPITGMLLDGPTPGSISFEDLSDAQIANPEVGQSLIYNGTGWENEFSSISPTTLAALQDVQITDPDDGDYLVYDEENSKWINSGAAPAPTYTDITVTLYGAVEDTISFTDAAGISHSEVFASGQSSKSVTFKINPSGSTSITFTSAVAKNPDDLSADYNKSVTITDATTEIKVMPDNSLYWWGYVDSNCESVTSGNGWSYETFTFNEPTYNNNSVRISSGQAKISGIGSKSTVQGSTVSGIIAGVTQINSVYGFLSSAASKVLYSSPSTEVQSTTMTKFDKTISNNDYVNITASSGRVSDIYAFWYE